MKKLIKSVFKITLFQIVMILIFGAIKYLMVKYGLSDKIQIPFMIAFAFSIFLLMISLGIVGIIENRGKSFEIWEQENKDSDKNLLLIRFIAWSRIIPVILGFLLFAYFFAPTSPDFFLWLIGGLVLRNCIDLFVSKKKKLVQESQQRSTT